MALAPAVMTATEDPTLDNDPNRPAGVFISYASEDHDIASSVYQSLQALGETVYDRIKIFLDSKSMDGGDEITADIKAGLKKSDFLVVLYTGVFKRSHGYTGWEVGFFAGLIEEEKKKAEGSTRRIIYLYCDEPPSIGDGILGISINVDGGDLGGTRADYVAKSAQDPDDPDALARVFHDVANRAESRLPLPLSSDLNDRDLRRNKRKKFLAKEIIPNLKGKLFDSMSTRVTRHSVEQKLIEFDFLPKLASEQATFSVPDDTRLSSHSGAFEIFGLPQQGDTMSWGQFCTEVRSRDVLCGSSMLLAVEQAVMTAVSPGVRLDNDQILKSSNDLIYRVLVTRQMDYYNGRKVVHVYFIQKLQDSPLGNNDTSTILGFINVAAKYRFIFIERDSLLSVESFVFEPDPAKIQSKARRLIRELLLIEEESRNQKLDQVSAISAYFGGDKEHLAVAKVLQDKWLKSRGELISSAQKILGLRPDSVEFPNVNREWLATLESFRNTSEEVNSVVTTQALDNLKVSFVMTPDAAMPDRSHSDRGGPRAVSRAAKKIARPRFKAIQEARIAIGPAANAAEGHN